MSEPLQHIRRGELPWQDKSTKTECGRDVTDAAHVISRDEAVAMWKRLGAQRAALFLCMTCRGTADRHRHWNESPIEATQRWLSSGEHWNRERSEQGERITRELWAIAAVIEAHREDFDAFLAGLTETRDLDAARKRRARS